MSSVTAVNKSRRQHLYQTYLTLVILTGLSLISLSIINVANYQPKEMFIVLLLLATFSEIATTSVPISDKAGITYDVGTTVSMAAIPIFGPIGATAVIAASNLGIWLLKPKNKTTWKKNWTQLGFNTGMHSLSIFSAGLVYTIFRNWLGADTWLGTLFPLLPAGIVYDQANFWLLMGVLRLQHGPQFDVRGMWQQNQWAMSLNIAVKSFGGAILAFAAARFGIIGVISFFLPILLSAYAFRLYVNQMREHMNHLEEIVAERTKELAARTERLARLDKQKDAFLAILSHDMKTSLTGIRVYASLMQEYPTLVNDEPQVAEDIMHSLDTLTSLVDNILDLERLDAEGNLTLKYETFDLNHTLLNLVMALKPIAEKKEIAIRHKINPAPAMTEADKGQIERIILNLISNAIKYSPRGGEVAVRAKYSKKTATIQIKDNGYGIPEEELPHIFNRFSRVDTLKSMAAGTGLGLAITKAIVEAHGGNISVTSQEGMGSIFNVTFPLNAP